MPQDRRKIRLYRSTKGENLVSHYSKVEPWSSLVEGDKQLDWPNSQTTMELWHAFLHNYFGFDINTTAFCLGRSSLHLLLLKSSWHLVAHPMDPLVAEVTFSDSTKSSVINSWLRPVTSQDIVIVKLRQFSASKINVWIPEVFSGINIQLFRFVPKWWSLFSICFDTA